MGSRTTLTSSAEVSNLLCPPVTANSPGLPLLKNILLDSSYYNYQVQGPYVCACSGGKGSSPSPSPRTGILRHGHKRVLSA